MIIIIINYLQSSSISPSLQFPGPFVCCSNLSTAREPLLHHPGHQKVTELQNILKLKYSKYPGYPNFCTTPPIKKLPICKISFYQNILDILDILKNEPPQATKKLHNILKPK